MKIITKGLVFAGLLGSIAGVNAMQSGDNSKTEISGAPQGAAPLTSVLANSANFVPDVVQDQSISKVKSDGENTQGDSQAPRLRVVPENANDAMIGDATQATQQQDEATENEQQPKKSQQKQVQGSSNIAGSGETIQLSEINKKDSDAAEQDKSGTSVSFPEDQKEKVEQLQQQLKNTDTVVQNLAEDAKQKDKKLDQITEEIKQQREESAKQREEDRKRQEEDRKRQEMENAKHNEEMSLVFKMLSEMQAAQKPQNPDEKK